MTLCCSLPELNKMASLLGEDFDQPVWSETSLSLYRNLGSLATHIAHSKDSTQSAWMHMLIWVFAGGICHFVGFIMLRLNYIIMLLLTMSMLIVLDEYGVGWVMHWNFETWNEPDCRDFDKLKITVQGQFHTVTVSSKTLIASIWGIHWAFKRIVQDPVVRSFIKINDVLAVNPSLKF